MTVIVQWVIQIVVFILIATMIELITPDNMMKKYVNLVVGLILILIFAQPLLYFLNIDMQAMLTEVEMNMLDDSDTLNMSHSLLENQKRDIQAEQDAYILSKVKEQLISEANPILFEQYGVKIADIDFTFSDEKIDKYEDLDAVTVYVTENNDKPSDISPIIIEFEDDEIEKANLTKRTEQVKTLLQDIWELHDKQIDVKWEGGTS